MNDTAIAVVAAPSCPRCGQTFDRRRNHQRYCSKPCARAATRNATRGSRKRENARRSRRHYERAAWLSYDLNRVATEKRRAAVLAILEAASGHDAALRNILLDPALLGADRSSPVGKLYPDNRCAWTPNAAKLVYAFCMEEWGCSTKDTIMDRSQMNGPWVPAYRLFKEEAEEATSKVPPHTYREPSGNLTGTPHATRRLTEGLAKVKVNPGGLACRAMMAAQLLRRCPVTGDLIHHTEEADHQKSLRIHIENLSAA